MVNQAVRVAEEGTMREGEAIAAPTKHRETFSGETKNTSADNEDVGRGSEGSKRSSGGSPSWSGARSRSTKGGRSSAGRGRSTRSLIGSAPYLMADRGLHSMVRETGLLVLIDSQLRI
jgi:hypothetical protein